MEDGKLLHYISAGYRLPCPPPPVPHNSRVHDIMLMCWDDLAANRPLFSHLSEEFEMFFPISSSRSLPSNLPSAGEFIATRILYDRAVVKPKQ